MKEFSEQIAICLENSEWERLSEVLSARQTYLEKILEQAENEVDRESLRELVESVLEEDKISLSLIQAQQQKLIELHGLMDQGMRAIKAYSKL
ncbi:flagellar protein FliT [Methylomonas sp. AM2-LC]|uniref:flagellar protein FliT n=1 Tax=Methylomonas sp. AM2-LC TaxID=3153301 RepID=UPI003267107E